MHMTNIGSFFCFIAAAGPEYLRALLLTQFRSMKTDASTCKLPLLPAILLLHLNRNALELCVCRFPIHLDSIETTNFDKCLQSIDVSFTYRKHGPLAQYRNCWQMLQKYKIFTKGRLHRACKSGPLSNLG